jgi:hypothetical protein
MKKKLKSSEDTCLRPGDLLRLLGLAVFSFFVTSFLFATKHALYWDNPFFFSIFQDNMQSLNRFGEFAWWYPHKQYGWPAYYYSMLGQLSFTGPIQVTLGILSWALGRCGIHLTSFYGWFVAWTGFIAPFVVSLGAYLLSLQLFRSRPISWYVAVLMAFSPGVMLNVSDVGLFEPAAYGLLFGAALSNFIRSQTRSAFYVLIFSSCLIGLNLNFPFIFWTAIAIPLFVFAILYFSRPTRKALATALEAIPKRDYAAAAILVGLCILPSLCILGQSGDLVRSRIGASRYEYSQLYKGNPLELVSASWPRFGFLQGQKDPSSWQFASALEGNHYGYNYLGILCVPLTFLGLLYGPKIKRHVILFLLVAAFAVIALSAYSPLFSLLLILPTPFRSNNHYGDCFYRSGGYLFLVFGAAVGLETLLRARNFANKRIFLIFIFWSILSVTMMTVVNGRNNFADQGFGLYSALAIFCATICFWFRYARTPQTKRSAIVGLVMLTFVDVSTFAFLTIRDNVNRSETRIIDSTPNPNGIGLKNDFPLAYSNSILVYQQLYDLSVQGAHLESLPAIQLFHAVHARGALKGDLELFNGTSISEPSIALEPRAISVPPFSEFANTAKNPVPFSNPKVELLSVTFNQVKLQVDVDVKSILFLKDAYSPYWKATVNGEVADITRAFWNFKALVVPLGKSVVSMTFEPPLVKKAIITAYLALILLIIFIQKLSSIEARLQKLVLNQSNSSKPLNTDD